MDVQIISETPINTLQLRKELEKIRKKENELKVILQAYTITVNNESMKKIVDTINEFL